MRNACGEAHTVTLWNGALCTDGPCSVFARTSCILSQVSEGSTSTRSKLAAAADRQRTLRAMGWQHHTPWDDQRPAARIKAWRRNDGMRHALERGNRRVTRARRMASDASLRTHREMPATLPGPNNWPPLRLQRAEPLGTRALDNRRQWPNDGCALDGISAVRKLLERDSNNDPATFVLWGSVSLDRSSGRRSKQQDQQ